MKRRALLIVILPVAVLAAQDSLRFERTYKVGEVDRFRMDLGVSMPGSEVAIAMDLTQTVKQAYPNGDADIESKSSNMKLKLNGQEMPNDAISGGEGSPATTQRFDKYYRPVEVKGEAPARGLMNQFNLMRYGVMLSGQALKVGETVPVVFENKENKTSVSGTAKLVSISNGLAKVESAVKIKNPETGDKAIDLKMTSQIDVSNSKPVRVEGVMTDLPNNAGMPINSIRFSMVRS